MISTPLAHGEITNSRHSLMREPISSLEFGQVERPSTKNNPLFSPNKGTSGGNKIVQFHNQTPMAI